jgi:SAM-dependent methyltransferase
LKATVKKILPRPIKTVLRRVYNSLAGNGHAAPVMPDGDEWVSSRATANAQDGDGLNGEPLPPREWQVSIGGGYVAVGAEFLSYFVELCDLKPHESILEAGCGVGRMAMPLTSYLNGEGLYEGFDISEEMVNWCRENITAKFPNFRFQAAAIYNGKYGAKAKGRASEFRFPYADEKFDLIFLTSVFTHMLPADVEHYFEEIARVMKPGGRCLITFFLLNEESTALIDDLKGEYNFEHRCKGYRTINRDAPEEAIAYPEEFVRSLYEKYGLKLREPIRYGVWCGRTDYLSFQDIVVAEKA